MFLYISNYVPLCMFVLVFVSFDNVLLIITACVFVLDESILGIFHIMFVLPSCVSFFTVL